VTTIDKFFKETSISAIAWQFALGRGCIPSSYLFVESDKNPVNVTGFTGEQSFMYYPYSKKTWDPYSVYVVNYYGSRLNSATPYNIIGYPSSLGLITKAGDNTPVGNVVVTLYGVKWGSKAVSDTVMTVTTDSLGNYTFIDNPYKPGINNGTRYCNFLIRAVASADTAYTWMPINEIGIAYFENPTRQFNKIIQFKL
jgi:hypothetical protein